MTETEEMKHVCPSCQHEFLATPQNSGRFTTCEKCGLMFKSETELRPVEAGDDLLTQLKTMNQHMGSIAATLRVFLIIFLISIGVNLLLALLALLSR